MYRVQHHILFAFISAFLLVASASAGILRDNFDDGDMNGWDLSEAGDAWKIENGELVIPPTGRPAQFLIGEPGWRDYTVRVKAKIVKHQPTGALEGPSIIARTGSSLNLYAFSLGTVVNIKTVYAFYVQGDIAAKHLKSEPFDWDLDTWYELELTAEKNKFKFYVNDELVIDYTDSVHPKGKVGISSAFIGTTAHLDDFSVTSDDIAETDFSVLPEDRLVTLWGRLRTTR